MKIVTFNLSCDWDSCDGKNSFIHRAGMIYEVLRAEMPDIIAFQEVIPKSMEFLRLICPDYEFFGLFRSENFDGEGLFTAVRKQAYETVAHESFWLSETQYEAGSRFSEQSECPRICVLTDVRNKATGFRIRLFNVHLDHISDSARELGIKCVLNKVKEYNDKKMVHTAVLGDFNASVNSKPVKVCEKYGLFDASKNENCTFHEFGKREEKLDYIFLDNDMRSAVKESFVLKYEKNGIYLSDHYPVGIVLEEDE